MNFLKKPSRQEIFGLLNFSLRIFLASLISYSISQAFFHRDNIALLYKIDEELTEWWKQMRFQNTKNLVVIEGSPDKLRKMYTLWPPYSHWFLYVIHVIGVAGALKYITSTNDLSLKPIQTFAHVKNAILLSVANSIWTLLPIRIAEIHLLVIALNFLHGIVTNLAIYFVVVWQPNFGIFKKIKREHFFFNFKLLF